MEAAKNHTEWSWGQCGSYNYCSGAVSSMQNMQLPCSTCVGVWSFCSREIQTSTIGSSVIGRQKMQTASTNQWIIKKTKNASSIRKFIYIALRRWRFNAGGLGLHFNWTMWQVNFFLNLVFISARDLTTWCTAPQCGVVRFKYSNWDAGSDRGNTGRGTESSCGETSPKGTKGEGGKSTYHSALPAGRTGIEKHNRTSSTCNSQSAAWHHIKLKIKNIWNISKREIYEEKFEKLTVRIKW